MKFQTFGAFLSLVASADAFLSECKAPSTLCKYVDKTHAQRCKSLIDAKKIQTSTCQIPKDTTTTITIHPTTTLTNTIYPPKPTKIVHYTVNGDGKPHVPRPTTVTATVTKTKKKTITGTTTSTSISTIFTTKKETTSTTATITSARTSVVPWTPIVCEAQRKLRRKSEPLPTECSCFITSTETHRRTKTATIKKPLVTKTVQEKCDKTPTVTHTVTVTNYGGESISAPRVTKTITKTITQTGHALVTKVERATTTSTKTDITTITSTTSTSTTTTETAQPCDDFNRLRGNAVGGFPNVLGQNVNSDTAKDCCQKCYGTENCSFFTYAEADSSSTCTHYYLQKSQQLCPGITPICPLGQAYFNMGLGGNDQFEGYIGPCYFGYEGAQQR